MMTMPLWAPQALAVQLLLTFFAPAIAIGTRSLFLPDLWCVVWTIGALWHGRKQLAGITRYLLIVTILFGAVYLHGYFRPSLELELRRTNYFFLSESDLFNPVREFVIYIRFLTWAVAARIVWAWFSRVTTREKQAFAYLLKILSACLLGELALLVLAKINPEMQSELAKIYGYDPKLFQWVGRGHGTFRSPLEAGTAMALGGLILASRAMPRNFLFWDGVVAAIGGIWLTHTATAAVGIIAVPFIYILLGMRSKQRWIALAVMLFSLAVILPVLYNSSEVVRLKWIDFTFRFMPWKMYLTQMAQRVDFLLLGFGFAPYHTDNSYLFIFNRAGLLGFGTFLAFIAVKIGKCWKTWEWGERAIVIYLLVGALTLDILVFRSTVGLMLAVGFPALAGRFKFA